MSAGCEIAVPALLFNCLSCYSNDLSDLVAALCHQAVVEATPYGVAQGGGGTQSQRGHNTAVFVGIGSSDYEALSERHHVQVGGGLRFQHLLVVQVSTITRLASQPLPDTTRTSCLLAGRPLLVHRCLCCRRAWSCGLPAGLLRRLCCSGHGLLRIPGGLPHGSV